MKKIIILSLFLLGFVTAYAQNTQSVIYLNNGNVIKGEIVASSSTKVEIKTTNGEVHSYKPVEIHKIDNGESLNNVPATKEKRYTEYFECEKGYWAAVDLGLGVILDRYNKNNTEPAIPIDLNLTMGYRFNEFIMIGVGGGARFYAHQHRQRLNAEKKDRGYAWSFPLYGQLRGAFISGYSRTIIPYWQLSVGYAFRDGFMVQPAVGLRFGSAVRNHFTLALGYTAQESLIYTNADKFQNGFMHMMQLKFGYQF
ncbi:MAG: hypothetical protein IIV65_03400 [Alistipes sp.]|nr:hypothetical protein [Alistipes sp.]